MEGGRLPGPAERAWHAERSDRACGSGGAATGCPRDARSPWFASPAGSFRALAPVRDAGGGGTTALYRFQGKPRDAVVDKETCRQGDLMKRFAVLAVAAIAVVGFFAQPAAAGNPHLKGRDAVAFTDNGLTLTATVAYAGLGNFDTEQRVTATGSPTATCTNPAGATQPPGQNPA